MKNQMNNSIFDLIKSHCVIFNTNLQNVKLPVGPDKYVDGIFQLDYLQWYPLEEKILRWGVPFKEDRYALRDNPNWVPSDYENVYIKSEVYGENMAVDYQLVIPGKSPVSVLNRYYFKVREGDKYVYKWRITVYGKALKLYYSGYIQWLRDYIIKYSGSCCRADLCWDFPCEFPNGIIDLKVTGTKYDTTYFGRDNSDIFFRKYNKTKDLKKDKNCFAWFYPKWYMKNCWRLEAQLTGRYSRSLSVVDWLSIMEVDNSVIQKMDKTDRNVYKTALYSVINTVDWVNLSIQEKMDILINSKNLIIKKIEKLKKQDL